MSKEVFGINVLALTARYVPPTLLIHYCKEPDHSKRFVHQVKVYLRTNATAVQIADELIRKEAFYIKESLISRTNLESLIQMFIRNKAKMSSISTCSETLPPHSDQREEELGKSEQEFITDLGNKSNSDPINIMETMARSSSEINNQAKTTSSEYLPTSHNIEENKQTDGVPSNGNLK